MWVGRTGSILQEGAMVYLRYVGCFEQKQVELVEQEVCVGEVVGHAGVRGQARVRKSRIVRVLGE